MRLLAIVILLLTATHGTCLAIVRQKVNSATGDGAVAAAAPERPAISKPGAQQVRDWYRDDFRLLSEWRQGKRATVGVMAAAKRVFLPSKQNLLFEGLTVQQVKNLLGQPRLVQNVKEAPRWTALHYAYQRGPTLVKATLCFEDGRWYGAIFSSSHILKDGTPGISIEWTHKVAPPPWLLGSDRPSPKGAVRSRG